MGGGEGDDVLRAEQDSTEAREATRRSGERCGAGRRRTERRAEAKERSDGHARHRHSALSKDASQSKKQRKVEYTRPYPERKDDGAGAARHGEVTADGPDRPKRKRVDGSVCYANSGEGSKRRCEATGRPPGRPPG